jgi:hypothetical protein
MNHDERREALVARRARSPTDPPPEQQGRLAGVRGDYRVAIAARSERLSTRGRVSPERIGERLNPLAMR